MARRRSQYIDCSSYRAYSQLTVNVCPADVDPEERITVTATSAALATADAGTVAVSPVALTYLVVSAVVPNHTTEPLAKLVPLTVSVKPAPPWLAEFGLRVVMAGAAVTVKLTADDAWPPGFATVTGSVPVPATAAAVAFACTSVALTKLVLSAVDPHITVVPLRKFVPFTVMVKPNAPAAILVGLIELMVGATTVTVAALDAAASFGFCTVTLRFPVAPSMLLGMLAVIDVAVTVVEVSAVVPT